MALVTIDLQEGFANDTVVIRLNGQEIFRRENVTTRLQIGLADRIEIQTQERSSEVEIELPIKKLVVTKEIACEKDIFLGVTFHAGGKLALREQLCEFWYA
ncbi:MAG: hypothetical protein ACC651_09965 [Candidatus Scalindua sp.]